MYLAELHFRLVAGAAALDEEVRRRHARFLVEAQNDDGGYGGRRGGSDLYYTGLALRALALVGELTGERAERAGRFLQSQLVGLQRKLDRGSGQDASGGRTSRPRSVSSVDLFSLVYGWWLVAAHCGWDVFSRAGVDGVALLRRHLGPLERPDGGWASSPSSRCSSIYHTFLGASALALLGDRDLNRAAVVQLVCSRQRPDGGFAEMDVLPRSGTNPTAAAVGLLGMCRAVDAADTRRAAQFLASMQGAEGGFRANALIPAADLLSTFTALVALGELQAVAAVDLKAAEDYARSLASRRGGFVAGVWDRQCDVEYTFYGLGTLALANVFRVGS